MAWFCFLVKFICLRINLYKTLQRVFYNNRSVSRSVIGYFFIVNKTTDRQKLCAPM